MSSSEDEFPSFDLALPCNNNNRSPSKRNIDNLFEQNQLLVEQYVKDREHQRNISTRINASEDVDAVAVEEQDEFEDTPVVKQQLSTCIFVKPKHLQYFSLNHLTLLKCGYGSVKELSPLEQFLISLQPDEIDKCIIQTSVFDVVKNLNPFVHYLLKTMSLHKNRMFIDSSMKIIKDLSTKPDVERIQFSSANIFKILFNCRADVMQSEIMKMVPDLRAIPIVCTPEDFLPKHSLLNLKSVLSSLSELLQGCTISEEDLCQVFKCLLLVGADADSTVYSEVQKCLVATLKRIPFNSWPMRRSIIAMSLTSLTDLPISSHWMYIYIMVKSIPVTCSRGIELRQYISVMALLNLVEADTLNHSLEYSDELFSILKLKFILESLYSIDESLQHIAIKFLDILINHLKFVHEENEILCVLLKKAEVSFSKKGISQVQVHLVKIHAKVYSKLSKGIIGRENQDSDNFQLPRLMDLNPSWDDEERPDEDVLFNREDMEEKEKHFVEDHLEKDELDSEGYSNDEMDAQQPTASNLRCRSIRIGSYKVRPLANNHFVDVILQVESLSFKAPVLTEPNKHVVISLCKDDIEQLVIHFGRGMPIMFVYTTPQFGESLQNALHMVSNKSPYFDPTSKDHKTRKLTFLIDKITEDQQSFIRQVFPGEKKVKEIDLITANEILVKSTPISIASIKNEESPQHASHVIFQKEETGSNTSIEVPEEPVICQEHQSNSLPLNKQSDTSVSRRLSGSVIEKYDSPILPAWLNNPEEWACSKKKRYSFEQNLLMIAKISPYPIDESGISNTNNQTSATTSTIVCKEPVTPKKYQINTSTDPEEPKPSGSGKVMFIATSNVSVKISRNRDTSEEKNSSLTPGPPNSITNSDWIHIPTPELLSESQTSATTSTVVCQDPVTPKKYQSNTSPDPEEPKPSGSGKVMLDATSSVSVKVSRNGDTSEEKNSSVTPGPPNSITNSGWVHIASPKPLSRNKTASINSVPGLPDTYPSKIRPVNILPSRDPPSVNNPERWKRATPSQKKYMYGQWKLSMEKRGLKINHPFPVEESNTSSSNGKVFSETSIVSPEEPEPPIPSMSVPEKVSMGVLKDVSAKSSKSRAIAEENNESTASRTANVISSTVQIHSPALNLVNDNPKKSDSSGPEIISSDATSGIPVRISSSRGTTATSTEVLGELILSMSVPGKMCLGVASDVSPKSSKSRDTAKENNELTSSRTLDPIFTTVQVHSLATDLLSFSPTKTQKPDVSGPKKNSSDITNSVPAKVSSSGDASATSTEVPEEPGPPISNMYVPEKMSLDIKRDISAKSSKNRDTAEENIELTPSRTVNPILYPVQTHSLALNLLSDDPTNPKKPDAPRSGNVSFSRDTTEVPEKPDPSILSMPIPGKMSLDITINVPAKSSKTRDTVDKNIESTASRTVNSILFTELIHSPALNILHDNFTETKKPDASELGKISSAVTSGIHTKVSSSLGTTANSTEVPVEPDPLVPTMSVPGKMSLGITSDVPAKSLKTISIVDKSIELTAYRSANSILSTDQVHSPALKILNDNPTKPKKPNAPKPGKVSLVVTSGIHAKISSNMDTAANSAEVPEKPDTLVSSISVPEKIYLGVTSDVSAESSKCRDTAEENNESTASRTDNSVLFTDKIHSPALNILSDDFTETKKPDASEPVKISPVVANCVHAKVSSIMDTTAASADIPEKLDPLIPSMSVPGKMSLDVTSYVPAKSLKTRGTVEKNIELTASRNANSKLSTDQIHSPALNILSDNPTKPKKLDALEPGKVSSIVTSGVHAKVSSSLDTTANSTEVPEKPDSLTPNMSVPGKISVDVTSDVSAESSKNRYTAEENNESTASLATNSILFTDQIHSLALNLLSDNPTKPKIPDARRPGKISSNVTRGAHTKVLINRDITATSTIAENNNRATAPGSDNLIVTTGQKHIPAKNFLSTDKPKCCINQPKLCAATGSPAPVTIKTLRFWHKYLCFQERLNLLQHSVACTFYCSTDSSGSPLVNVDIWPDRLQLQLIPKELVTEISLKTEAQRISINFAQPRTEQQSEALNKLREKMSSGMMGFIQFPENCNLRFMYMNQDGNKYFYGVIPHDQISSFLHIQRNYQNYCKQQEIDYSSTSNLEDIRIKEDLSSQENTDIKKETLPVVQVTNVNEIIDQLLRDKKLIESLKESTSSISNQSLKSAFVSGTSLTVPEIPLNKILDKNGVNDSNVPVFISGTSSSVPEIPPIILETEHPIQKTLPSIPGTSLSISETQFSVPENTTINENKVSNLNNIPETYSVYDSNIPVFSSDIADISCSTEPCIYSENVGLMECYKSEDKTEETGSSDDELEIVAVLPPKSQSRISTLHSSAATTTKQVNNKGTLATSSSIVNRNERISNGQEIVYISDSDADSSADSDSAENSGSSQCSLTVDIVVSQRTTNLKSKKKSRCKKKKSSRGTKRRYFDKQSHDTKKLQNKGKSSKDRSSKQPLQQCNEQNRPNKRLKEDNASIVKRSQQLPYPKKIPAARKDVLAFSPGNSNSPRREASTSFLGKRPCSFTSNILEKRPKVVNNKSNQNQEKSAIASNINSSLSNEFQDGIETIDSSECFIIHSDKEPPGIIILD